MATPATEAKPTTTEDFHLDQTGALAAVSRNDGKQLEGLIVGFDAASRSLTLELESGTQQTLPLSELRAIEFKRACIAPALTPGAPAPGVPASPEEAALWFKDGTQLKASYVASLVGPLGLHLYRYVSDHLTEIFIPFSALERYHIAATEPLLGRATVTDAQAELSAAVRNANELRARLHRHIHRAAEPLGQLLIKGGVITRAQLEQALVDLRHAEGKRLGDILVETGATTATDIQRALADKFDLPFVPLREYEVDPSVLTEVPVDVSRRYRFMPLALDGKHLVVAIEDPSDVEAINLLRFVVGRNVDLAVATREDIEWAINHYYGDAEGEELARQISAQDLAQGDSEPSGRDAEELGQQRPVVRLVENTLLEAIGRRASDIHIVPCDKTFEVFYRVDGVLQKVRSFKKSLLPAVVSRIKILGRMDISEHRLPQDGQTRVLREGRPVDLRISVIPTIAGESVVIRVLSTQVGQLDLRSLGLVTDDEKAIKNMLTKIHGMFLVTGPTGSGKSTTLYAALKEVRSATSNIITVEDPVEYRIEGVRQIQVKKDIEYTFTRALRHILRHDPDVIMIGEMRDVETATIAIESALTGHLVLSTLHTNSAASTVVRLLDMGIEPFLIASTIRGVLGQRLIRCNCENCIAEDAVEPAMRNALGAAAREKFYRGQGCDQCNGTGYRGRLMAYELMLMTPQLRALVRPGVTADELHAKAVACGMVPLVENALAAARARKTSLSEVFRLQLD
jgi:type IV pilus assembly protein PilB